MDIVENALLVVDEELGELASECLAMQKRIKKVMRFSADEIEPAPLNTLTNAERVNAEWNDVIGAVLNLKIKGFPINLDLDQIEKKLNKIIKFEQHSRDNGTLQD